MAHALLTFQDSTFEIVDWQGQPWLRGGQIDGALGYKDPDSGVARLYARNAAEFTPQMTEVIDLPTPGGVQPVRIFSLRGAYLLACGQFAVCALVSGALGTANETLSAEGLRAAAGAFGYDLLRWAVKLVDREAERAKAVAAEQRATDALAAARREADAREVPAIALGTFVLSL